MPAVTYTASGTKGSKPMSFPLLIAFLIVPLLGFLVRESRRAHWTLLESIVAMIVLGHVVAVPIVLTYRYWRYSGLLFEKIAIAAVLGLTLATAMALGAMWVFRGLSAIRERRAHVRLIYM